MKEWQKVESIAAGVMDPAIARQAETTRLLVLRKLRRTRYMLFISVALVIAWVYTNFQSPGASHSNTVSLLLMVALVCNFASAWQQYRAAKSAAASCTGPAA